MCFLGDVDASNSALEPAVPEQSQEPSEEDEKEEMKEASIEETIDDPLADQDEVAKDKTDSHKNSNDDEGQSRGYL